MSFHIFRLGIEQLLEREREQPVKVDDFRYFRILLLLIFQKESFRSKISKLGKRKRRHTKDTNPGLIQVPIVFKCPVHFSRGRRPTLEFLVTSSEHARTTPSFYLLFVPSPPKFPVRFRVSSSRLRSLGESHRPRLIFDDALNVCNWTAGRLL